MKKFVLIVIAIILITTIPAPGQNIPIKFSNNSFEEFDTNDYPSLWKVNTQGKVASDKNDFHSGRSSLFIRHITPGMTTVSSEEVSLTVGRIYRLSGWVKTEEAFTDPADRYPTPVAGTLTMESFPFTNNTIALGGTNYWQRIEGMFIAIKSKDKIELHLGYNGNAVGKIWFDDIELEEVTDIAEYIPMETVKWYGPAFRYEDKGWIFVHIEGKPYQRGFQYGYLLADEIKMFIEKLAVNSNSDDPESAWRQRRTYTDAILLRKYDEEYLEEMKGIADGAAKAGANVYSRPVDFLDIVSINSAIDLDYIAGALRVTPNPLTGKSFLADEDDLLVPEQLHKCSSFLANNSSTKDKRIVFGQLFMWGGYTGYHWNVILDIQPAEGNRLVFETYPGGIHSGADFYINSAGIMLGETTVQQTPYNENGTPQSNRIRKAAQYAASVDDVEKIMTEKNNGMYTNDWLIGDVKRNEIGILLLGTRKHKLWRSGNNDWYGDTKDFYWSVNNNKDMEVRKEYVVNNEDSPNDIIWRPSNRDIAFYNFYKEGKGNIDHQWAIKVLGSSPINRPHACDGKVTTSEMAEQLVFLAHSGKVTLREQIIGENGRMPDLPNAYSRLTLGYAVASPVYIADAMKAKKNSFLKKDQSFDPRHELREVKELYSFEKETLWKGTVYPARDSENWFVSASAAYYNLLKQQPGDTEKSVNYIKDELTELNYRYLYTASKEGTVVPSMAVTSYDKYNNYQIPRIKGTYLLHQLRLMTGNKTFSVVMNKIHNDFKEKNIKTEDIIISFNKMTGKDSKDIFNQWLDRDDLPDIKFETVATQSEDAWNLTLKISQQNKPYHFFTTIAVDLPKERIVKLLEISGSEQNFTFTFDEKPVNVIFNYGNDIPVYRKNYFTYQNFFDDFSNTKIIYGTIQQVESNHTIALNYQKMVADRFTEVFQPIQKDSETDLSDLGKFDIILLGGSSDNSITRIMMEKLGINSGKYFFEWNGGVYSDSDDGLCAVFPNPYNPQHTVYLFYANSAQQLLQMTKKHQSAPAWALYKGDKIVKKGYHSADGF